MRATFHWLTALCTIALATGSRSCAVWADQVHPLPGANEEVALEFRTADRRDPASQIIITGSRIPRNDLTAVSPVTRVNSNEFQLVGATNVEEVLNQLPQVNPSQGEFNLAGVSGAATVDLRGLGAVRTLVLVNGHRLMPGDPRYLVPDINSMPTSIVQRVEVLTGGAAAAYGSDAVAGVVNFIVDTKLDGLKIEGRIGGFQHSNRDTFARTLLDQRGLPYPSGGVFDGRRKDVSVALGRGLLDERAHIAIYGGYRQISAVEQTRRDYGACPITARILRGSPSSILECGGPLVSYPGNYFDNLGNAYQVTVERNFVPGITRFNSSAWNLYQRPGERYTAGGFANFDLSKAVQLYAEVMAMRDRSLWQIGPSGDFRDTETINCDNPLLSIQQRSLICRTGNFVGEIPTLDDNGNLLRILGSPTQFTDPVTRATYSRAWLLVARRSVEGGPIQDDLRHRSIRALGGLKGDLGRGVSYDASYQFGDVTLDRQYRNNLSITRLVRALDVVSDPSSGRPICRSVLIARNLGPSGAGADENCVPWDVFATGQVSPQSVAYLSVPPSMHGSFRQQVGNVNATVDLDRWGIRSPWSDDGSAINVGAEFRRDTAQFDPDAFSQTGDIAGFGDQVFPIRNSISTNEIFGEVRVPIVTSKVIRRLTFEGGLRQSWYKGSGSKFSSSAYKVAFDLTPVSGIRIRASQQRAIRAPNIIELFAPAQPDSFNRDPCAGSSPAASQSQCALAGVTPAQYGHISNFNGLFEYNAIIGGNENLQPEAAYTRTIGMVLQPRFFRGFNATIDWWDIRLRGAIATIGAQTIIDNCVAGGDPIFCSRIHRDSSGSLLLNDGNVDNRQANLGSFRISGIDASADYSVSLGRMGSANLQFRGAYVLRWITDNGGLSTAYDCAGLFGTPCGTQPRWKHTARASWHTPYGIMLSSQWRHIGGVKLAALDPSFNLTDQVSSDYAKLRAQDYLDVATVFKFREGFEFRLGINNLLDRQPPLIVGNTAAGDGPYNGNTYPNWYDPLGRYLFASVRVALNPKRRSPLPQ